MLNNYDQVKQDVQELNVGESFANFACYDEKLREKLNDQESELKQTLYRRHKRRRTEFLHSSLARIQGSQVLQEVHIDSFLCNSGQKSDEVIKH